MKISKISEDEKYMLRCLQLARNGMQNVRPNPMVGAVIVYDGRIIGEGYHEKCGEGHAEVNAFASVKKQDEHLLAEATMYVSLEPCSHYGKTPPCADLIIKKGIKRVVCGCIDPFAEVQGRGIQKLRNAGIQVTVGVLERECMELNKYFVTYNKKKRPFIILKWAQTCNGFIDDNYKPLTISSDFTKMLSHKLRAENDAILIGRVTDEREHSKLNVREWTGNDPLRLVLTHEQPIDELMNELYEKKIQSLIVEGGTQTLTSFISDDLWDEIRVEFAPFAVDRGTLAPRLPLNVYVFNVQEYGDNVILTYHRR